MALGLVAAGISGAAAQDYPNRPIRVITSIAAGGTWDIFVRRLGEEITKTWGYPFVIEPRAGGAWMISGRTCATADPDGYTLCALSGETLIHPEFLNKTVPYDTQTAFAPIVNFFFTTQMLVVNASLKAKTYGDLAKVARAQPKSLAFVGPGISNKLFLDRFNREFGTDIVYVPFRGGGDALNNMLQGSIQMALFGLTNFVPYLRDGSMVGLAVDGDERSSMFPDVPTAREVGYKGPLVRNYLGMVAPAGTPKAIIDKVNAELVRIIRNPEFRQKYMIDMGLEPIADTPEHFAAFLKSDREQFQQVIKETGLEPQ
jgi:tripartite-type tricarboxylate transporter receptor subunit TctC